MTRGHSHEGFWLVAEAAKRLRPKGWRLRAMDLWFPRFVRLAGIRWQRYLAIYVNETLPKDVNYVFLWPPDPFPAADRRRWRKSRLEPEIHRNLKTLGYRRRSPDFEDRGPAYERPLKVGATFQESKAISKYFSDGTSIRPIPRGRRSGEKIRDLLKEFPRLHRAGWLAYHLDLVGPTIRFRGAGCGWTLIPNLHWFAREGVTVDFVFESDKKFKSSEVRELERNGFLQWLARGLRRRGLLSVTRQPNGRRPSPIWMAVGQSNMRPQRARRILNRLRDWKPTE